LIYPKKTSLKARLKTDNALFLDFLAQLLRVRPLDRPTASEALKHPWLAGVSDEFSSAIFRADVQQSSS